MAYRDIVVHASDNARNSANWTLAGAIAGDHKAHLCAHYTYMPYVFPAYVEAYVPADIIARQESERMERAEAAKAEFEEFCRLRQLSHEWHFTRDDPIDTLSVRARYADLVVVGQEEEASTPLEMADLPPELVLGCGRPMIVVPYAGKFNGVGQRVLVAWNGSREAARAVHDALPLLKRARKTIVFSVDADMEGHLPGADISAHLARHGVIVEAAQTVAKDIDIADAILGAVSDYSADLLVMGAWGHSRLRERVLGGVTRHVLKQMTVPVLMSH
jgi:nucleotide-binding universal stress UspA family protein